MPKRSRSESISHAIASGNPIVVKNADELLEKIGNRNKYVLFVMCTVSLSWAITAMPIMCSPFITDPDECTNETVNCDTENRTTITTEFDLRNGRKYLAEWTTSAFMIGNMIGASCLTRFSDKFGRRPVLIISLIVAGIAGMLSALANDIISLTLGRLVQGICSPGTLLIAWVLGYECVPIDLRGFVTLIFGVMWVIGYCSVAPLAYLINDWRWLMFACTMPSILLAILYLLLIPESLHYMIANGKTRESILWVRNAERFGHFKDSQSVNLMIEYLLKVDTQKQESEANQIQKKFSVIAQLLHYKIFILYTAVLVFLWTSDSFIYFGLSLYTTRLAGDKYWNYALSGLIELPAYISAPTVLENYGRRRIVSLTHFLAGLSFFALLFIPEDIKWFQMVFWLSAKLAISLSFMSIYVYGSEVFPTTIRNVCLGMCVVVARFGGVAAPYVTLLGAISPLLPIIIFGSVSLIAGALTLILPETKDRVLPNSLNDLNKNDQSS